MWRLGLEGTMIVGVPRGWGRGHQGSPGQASSRTASGSLIDVAGIRVGHYTGIREGPTGRHCRSLRRAAICRGPTTTAPAPGEMLGHMLQPAELCPSPSTASCDRRRAHGAGSRGRSGAGPSKHVASATTGARRTCACRSAWWAPVIDDLLLGDGRIRLDPEAAVKARQAAAATPVLEGSIGAGTGATVGKMFRSRGLAGMKGGIGTVPIRRGDVVLAALAVVSCRPETSSTGAPGRIVAGARTSDGSAFVNSAAQPPQRDLEAGPAAAATQLSAVPRHDPDNDRHQRGARQDEPHEARHDGEDRRSAAINLYHTQGDGDQVIAASTNRPKRDASPTALGLRQRRPRPTLSGRGLSRPRASRAGRQCATCDADAVCLRRSGCFRAVDRASSTGAIRGSGLACDRACLVHRALCIVPCASCLVHRASWIAHSASCIVHLTPPARNLSLCRQRLTEIPDGIPLLPIARARWTASIRSSGAPDAARTGPRRPRGVARRCRGRRRPRAWQSGRWRRVHQGRQLATRSSCRASARRRRAEPSHRAVDRRGDAPPAGRAPTAGCRCAGLPHAREQLAPRAPHASTIEPLERRQQAPALALDSCGFIRGGLRPPIPRGPITRKASSRCCPALKPPATRCQRISRPDLALHLRLRQTRAPTRRPCAFLSIPPPVGGGPEPRTQAEPRQVQPSCLEPVPAPARGGIRSNRSPSRRNSPTGHASLP